MTPTELIAVLRRLQALGWPLEVCRNALNEEYAMLKLPLGNAYHFYPRKKTDMWVLEGWLREELEARGYRREVYQNFSFGLSRVIAIAPGEDTYVKHDGGWHDIELSGSLATCLAVAGEGEG